MFKHSRVIAAVLAVLCLSAFTVAFAQDNQAARQEARKKALAYWKRADSRRLQRKYDDAKSDYENAAKYWQEAGNGNFATVTRQMVPLCEAMPMDLKKLTDGTYTGTARGYSANVTVEVTIKGGKFTDYKVTDQRESRALKSLVEIPQRIVRARTPSVDVTSGATVTSYAVMSATQQALDKAKGADDN